MAQQHHCNKLPAEIDIRQGTEEQAVPGLFPRSMQFHHIVSIIPVEKLDADRGIDQSIIHWKPDVYQDGIGRRKLGHVN